MGGFLAVTGTLTFGSIAQAEVGRDVSSSYLRISGGTSGAIANIFLGGLTSPYPGLAQIEASYVIIYAGTNMNIATGTLTVGGVLVSLVGHTHPASQITAGTFATGDFVFQGHITSGGQVRLPYGSALLFDLTASNYITQSAVGVISLVAGSTFSINAPNTTVSGGLAVAGLSTTVAGFQILVGGVSHFTMTASGATAVIQSFASKTLELNPGGNAVTINGTGVSLVGHTQTAASITSGAFPGSYTTVGSFGIGTTLTFGSLAQAEIFRNVNNDYIRISGGSSGGVGANIVLGGATYSTPSLMSLIGTGINVYASTNMNVATGTLSVGGVLVSLVGHTHAASQITAGTFGAGSYGFPNGISVTDRITSSSVGNVSAGIWMRYVDGNAYYDSDKAFYFRTNGDSSQINALILAAAGGATFAGAVTVTGVLTAGDIVSNTYLWAKGSYVFIGPTGLEYIVRPAVGQLTVVVNSVTAMSFTTTTVSTSLDLVLAAAKKLYLGPSCYIQELSSNGIYFVASGSIPAMQLIPTGSTGQSNVFIRDFTSGSLKQITFGANGSGGTGKKLLCVID